MFACRFGAAATGWYQLVAPKVMCRLSAYEYSEGLTVRITVGEKSHEKHYPKKGSVRGGTVLFLQCVLNGRQPEPSGWEGLAECTRHPSYVNSRSNVGEPLRSSGSA